MNEITIQGVKIALKQQGCNCNGSSTSIPEPYVSINVYITNNCNARCQFCCNVDSNAFTFDMAKFRAFIDEVVAKVKIRKITFTGGEPSLEIDTLMECVQYVKARCENITLFTNGHLFTPYVKANDIREYQELFRMVDNISVSYHHWDVRINQKIFGLRIPLYLHTLSKYELRKINLSCNLMKGYVDSQEKMCRYMERAHKMGINEVAFVRLMPVNEFAKANAVADFALQSNDCVLEYRKWNYPVPDVCQCQNYLYRTKDNNFVKFYVRRNLCPSFDQGSFLIYKYNKVQNWY